MHLTKDELFCYFKRKIAFSLKGNNWEKLKKSCSNEKSNDSCYEVLDITLQKKG